MKQLSSFNSLPISNLALRSVGPSNRAFQGSHIVVSPVSKCRRGSDCTLRRPFSSTPSILGKSKSLDELPDKVHVKTGPLGRLAKMVTPRVSDKITTRVGSSFGGNHSLEWVSPPKNVLLIKKREDKRALAAMSSIIEHIKKEYPQLNIIVEQDPLDELNGRFEDLTAVGSASKSALSQKTDFVLTLGGDGTILHVSHLFDQAAVPPVLSFSMGTLGFLLPYDIESYQTALRDLISSKVSLLLRMRLRLTLHAEDGSLLQDIGEVPNEMHLMNEVTLHRGRSPHMTKIDAFVDERHLTQAISDGLIIATPTGSTAYSLSSGGPIVHPSVQSLVLTPICPRSLSFRTVLLPSDSRIQLKISPSSRSSAELTIDGRAMLSLSPGSYLQVGMSPFPIPCVNCSSGNCQPRRNLQSDQEISTLHGDSTPVSQEKLDPEGEGAGGMGSSDRGEDDWVRDINTLLKFNATFSGRGLLGGNGSYEEEFSSKKG